MQSPRRDGREQGPEESGESSRAPGRRPQPGDQRTEGKDGVTGVDE